VKYYSAFKGCFLSLKNNREIKFPIARRSGLPYIVNFLNGAGGHNYGLKNAQRTAKLYDGLHPTMVNTSGRFIPIFIKK